ncbi:tRNA-intron lyase [Candidatus Pacearchaeota archaeon]|nr:tRNA-intron lyase [Candidatus Pacearchaeota archaeon]
MITIHSTHTLSSTSPEAFTLYEKSWIGEKIHNRIEYMPIETLFLYDTNKAQIEGKKQLSRTQLITKLKKRDTRLLSTYAIYRDLRTKGYIVKSALKFGGDFRVYEKGVTPESSHAKWILHAFQSTEKTDWHNIAAKLRVTHATKKAFLIALTDRDNSVSYYEMNWQRT